MHNIVVAKAKIKTIKARMILDSRGNPTVEADVTLKNGSFGRAAVPSGASTGSHEAVELRDGNAAYGGKGVQNAIRNIHAIIAPKLASFDASDQKGLDKLLIEIDGTDNKSHLGANAVLAVSLATAKAYAHFAGLPLCKYFQKLGQKKSKLHIPIPMCNIANGAKHAPGSSIDFQEFSILPTGIDGYSRSLRACSEIFHSLGKNLQNEGYQPTVADEGGYSPKLQGSNSTLLDYIVGAIRDAGYKPGKDIFIALDIAASEFYGHGSYNLNSENRKLDSAQLLEYYSQLVKRYPIASIEDGLDENDWDGWEVMTKKFGKDMMIVGDDLLVTNPKLIKKAVFNNSANALLVKPNQIGTLSETIEAVNIAKSAGWKTVMSHRSGETEDTTIAHLAVGLGTDYIKAGSMSRSERLAKYNELLRIAEVLNV